MSHWLNNDELIIYINCINMEDLMKILLTVAALLLTGCTVIMSPDEEPTEECHYTCYYNYCTSDDYVYECTYQ